MTFEWGFYPCPQGEIYAEAYGFKLVVLSTPARSVFLWHAKSDSQHLSGYAPTPELAQEAAEKAVLEAVGELR